MTITIPHVYVLAISLQPLLDTSFDRGCVKECMKFLQQHGALSLSLRITLRLKLLVVVWAQNGDYCMHLKQHFIDLMDHVQCSDSLVTRWEPSPMYEQSFIHLRLEA